MNEPKETIRISISIATYNRPQGLRKVMSGIEALEVAENINLRVIIVDNSNDGNASEYSKSQVESFRWPLSYFHETERGISFSRNRGLLEALNFGDDYIAFIDDDERPSPSWITELLQAIKLTDASAVSGAVKARFETKPPWWAEKGRFFDVLDYPDLTAVDFGHTSNALVNLKIVRRISLNFDHDFALSGGEDTLFFKGLRNSGQITAFSRKALVTEFITSDRATLPWLLKRWFRTGNTDALILLHHTESKSNKWVTVLIGGIARVFIGLLGALVTLPLLLIESIAALRFIRVFCRGIGFLASLGGWRYEEYRFHNR